MDTGGYSWTGGGENFPKSPYGKRAFWRDKRTCVLPVDLQPDHFYRVGINAPSFHNFRSAKGVPVEPTAIYFKTRAAAGQAQADPASAAPALEPRIPPRILLVSPANGATDVDPALSEIRVTFNVAMQEGYSWCGGGETFPAVPAGSPPYWTLDAKTFVVPVQLRPNAEYRIGINTPRYRNFQSRGGMVFAPMLYTFRTGASRGDSAPAAAAAFPAAAAPGAPRVVKLEPENGASGVSAKLTELRVTFEMPMRGGCSWCGGGPNFPEIPAGQKPAWSADRKTCTLPVALKPNWTYQLGLNAPSFKNFQSEGGMPLEPVAYSFTTGQ
jgi:hypothetical protein